MPAPGDISAAAYQWLYTRRKELEDIRFSGVGTVVDQSGERIVYRSQAEIETAIAALDREMAAQRGRRPSGLIRIRTSKGL